MFSFCSFLKEINIPNLNNNNSIDKEDMFEKCSDELKKKFNVLKEGENLNKKEKKIDKKNCIII